MTVALVARKPSIWVCVYNVEASAFNRVEGNGAFALTGTIAANDVTLATTANTTRQEFVDLVNANVAG